MFNWFTPMNQLLFVMTYVSVFFTTNIDTMINIVFRLYCVVILSRTPEQWKKMTLAPFSRQHIKHSSNIRAMNRMFKCGIVISDEHKSEMPIIIYFQNLQHPPCTVWWRPKHLPVKQCCSILTLQIWTNSLKQFTRSCFPLSTSYWCAVHGDPISSSKW